MPIGLMVIGAFLIAAGYNNTQDHLFGVVKKTYESAKGLTYWVLLCVILGFLASIGEIKEVVNAFILLLCLALALSVGGK